MRKEPTPRILVSPWLSLLQAVLVRYVKVSDEWIARAKEAASRGPVVFVLRNRNLIDFLCLRGICARHDLPSLGFVSGLSRFSFLPLWKYLLTLFFRHDRLQRDRLADTLKNGGCALIFLRRPALRDALGSRPTQEDGIQTLVEAQGLIGTTALALPTVFLWGEAPMKRTRGNFSFLFGTSEYPRLLRSIWLLVRKHSVHELISGEPIDLAALRAERGDDSARLQGILRTHVGRHIEQIRRSRLGSFTKPSSRVKAEVARSGRLRKELEVIAAEANIPQKEIPARTRDIIEKLATDFRPNILALFAVIMAFLWKKLYRGFHIDEQAMERIRAAVGEGPLLLLPCHRSHVDYLAISETMNAANIMLPHIAAGDNLAFWPMEFFFRSCGAFFIRRKFVDDKFYRAVVNAYIRRLIHENYTIEVFIEGGRSRTGRMLRPKLGMLEMALNAMASIPGKNPGVLPIFIGYDRVIEEDGYVREAQGRSKQSESAFGLLKSATALSRNYGKLYVRAGRFFTVADVLSHQQVSPEQLTDGGMRREVAQEIALRTLMDINDHCIIHLNTIAACALLTDGTPVIPHERVAERCAWLSCALGAMQVTRGETAVLAGGGDPQAEQAVLAALAGFVKEKRVQRTQVDGHIRWRIRTNARFGLDYYRNHLLHCFVPASIAAVPLLAQDTCSRATLKDTLCLAAGLYRWEFLLPDPKKCDTHELDELTDRAIGNLLTMGLVEQAADTFRVTDRDNLRYVGSILRSCHEIYHCALEVTRDKVLSESTINTSTAAKKHFDAMLKTGTYRMSEGQNRIVFQNALSALRDLRLNRPSKDETPYGPDGMGTQLHQLLQTALDVTKP